MKNFIVTIILGCFTLLLCNCHKGQDLPVIVLDSDTLIDPHFNFKKGTYWIYRDSLNGRIDSFFVTSNYSIKQGGEYDIYQYHFITISEYNIDHTHPADSAAWTYNFQDNKIVMDYYYGRNGYGWKSDINYNPLFQYPYLVGDNVSNFDTAIGTTILNVYPIDTVRLYNVAVMHQYISVLPANVAPGLTTINDYFYVNDSVGMIKMRINHPLDSISHVWELQRYKIVK